MQALKALESREYESGATVRFQDVDYNVLTFKEQIKIDLGELDALFSYFHMAENIYSKYLVVKSFFASRSRKK